ncbi:class I SAM-dependent methyltransferase [Chloroflexota bacterium]
MGYYDDEQNVREYIDMAEGFDGRELVEKLSAYLPGGSTVLELGMGPGVDLDLLSRRYRATGSDTSEVFLSRYSTEHPDANLVNLDAVTLDTGLKFQGIYSNKVLHHLTREELQRSFVRQAEVLSPNGIALHTFWHGEGKETHHGLRFVYHRPDGLKAMIPADFQILEISLYQEMEDNDSICLVIRRGQRQNPPEEG